MGDTSSECVFDALSFGGQMVMFRNRERVCGRLLCGSIPDNIIDCCQNNKICYVRVLDCAEKVEDCITIGFDSGGLLHDICGLVKCGDENFRMVVIILYRERTNTNDHFRNLEADTFRGCHCDDCAVLG